MNRPIFDAFTDETKVRVLNLLAQRDCCECEFETVLQVPPPGVSRHLANLHQSGLVKAYKSGKWTIYSLAKPQQNVRGMLKNCFGDIESLKQDVVVLRDLPNGCGKVKTRRESGQA